MACTIIKCTLSCKDQQGGFCHDYLARQRLATSEVQTIMNKATCLWFKDREPSKPLRRRMNKVKFPMGDI
jgi:hypothetical protein